MQAAEEYLHKHPFDIVYVAGDACDITTKDEKSSKISFDWDSSGDDLENHLIRVLTKADGRIRRYFPASRVVYCPLIGSDLARVVSDKNVTEEDQAAVERAVWGFNTKAFELNEANRSFSLPLHHQVHRFCKGKKKAYYHHLPDGLHLSDSLKDKWAKEFVKAMAHN